MLIKKELPETSELVIIKIEKILPHGAYCKLTEYGLEAYLPISEISSGWVKNIHEFVREGQQDVARVISADKTKRTIDISLKKRTEKDKKTKIDDYSMEKRSEGIFNQAITASKMTAKKEDIVKTAAKKVSTYTDLVNEVYEGQDPLSELHNKSFKDAFKEIVMKTIKPKVFTVSYKVELKAATPKTKIKQIKSALKSISDLGVEIVYLGAPYYKFSSTGDSYPKAESRIRAAEELLSKDQKSIFFKAENITK